jgi:esterase/lipase
MEIKKITIPCAGYEIAADWYDGNNSVLLVLPGFTSSKKSYEPLVSAIVEKTGTSALVIDYSGHGESPFDIQDITISENFSEVVRAYDWIKEKYPERTIDVMGTSYGGFFAAKLTSVREIRKMILRVPAADSSVMSKCWWVKCVTMNGLCWKTIPATSRSRSVHFCIQCRNLGRKRFCT